MISRFFILKSEIRKLLLVFKRLLGVLENIRQEKKGVNIEEEKRKFPL